ncbi:MAG TPA: diguanylate cyclase [Burkholderiales bacterium]
MRRLLLALWRAGTHGAPPARVREIALTNLIALLATASTLPYEVFYLTDLAHYAWIFVANIPFIATYASVLLLNRAGRFEIARVVAIGAVYVHIPVVLSLISSGSGCHLFYFPMAAAVAAVFGSHERTATALWVGLGALLYVVCHFAFPPGTTPVVMSEYTLRAMYAATSAGVLVVTGGFSYLFRIEIDRAESALTESNQALARLSTVDPVTGLANRRAIDAYVSDQWARLERQRLPMSLLLIDVDCFKSFNDHYGHLAGDGCLERVAEALRATTRRREDLIARYGGEEFVIVLPATDEDAAAEMAEHVRESIELTGIRHDFSSVGPVVTVSIGVAGGRVDELGDFSTLLHRADSALYAAKHGGRNRIVSWHALGDDATLTARRRRLAAVGERA